MWFWKVFAWIAAGWALVMRRGDGISIKQTSANESDTPKRESGPTWRRVSSSSGPYPARSARPGPEPAADAASSAPSDQTDER